jgi:transcription elongation GreA/GreB family factor
MDSPLGSALLGRSAGDEVAVRRPKGDAVFEITGVRYRS